MASAPVEVVMEFEEEYEVAFEEVRATLFDMMVSYRDKLILYLQQGYEDSSFRYSDTVEEADVVDLQDHSSLEEMTVDELVEYLQDWVEEYFQQD